MKETNQIPLEKPSSIREEDEQKIAMYAKELESSNLVEDIKFREIAKSKEAIQEILRVILDEDDLIVLESIEQKDITESIFHGVILDCLCKLSTGELTNIEMQTAFRNAPVKRMRYNQSAMTIAHSPKDKYFDYEKIPSIISIMFCSFDIFGLKELNYDSDYYDVYLDYNPKEDSCKITIVAVGDDERKYYTYIPKPDEKEFLKNSLEEYTKSYEGKSVQELLDEVEELEQE